jgi:hypothetical protein
MGIDNCRSFKLFYLMFLMDAAIAMLVNNVHEKVRNLACYAYSIHRCTRVENPGEGVPDVFCQNP